MEVKVSEYTPFLLIGLAIVVIIKHFYDPLQLTDMWKLMNENQDMSIPIPIMKGIITIFLPVAVSMIELMDYMFEIAKAMHASRFVVLFIAELTCLGYLMITYCLEKFHAYWHEEESVFAMCVDMLCIENIVMYIFNLICYAASRLFQNAGITDEIYIALALLIALPTVWGLLFQVTYFMAGFLVGAGVPVLVTLLLANVIGETIASWIMLILFILFSQVIWRLCSEFIYDKLLEAFSLHHLSLLE